MKAEIQICDIFIPQNLKNPKSANLNSHEKFPATR